MQEGGKERRGLVTQLINMEGLNTMYKVQITTIMMTMMMMLLLLMVMMMMTLIFNSLLLQVAYDDGEVISERIIYRYLEGDLYMEA